MNIGEVIDPNPPKKSWNCAQWVAVIVVGLLGLSYFLPTFGSMPVKALQASTSANARLILTAMRAYAEENGGLYPDSIYHEARTSNEVFRELFRDGFLLDELSFGGKVSRFNPDSDIGDAPDFAKAVMAGENHWAWVAAQSLRSPAHHPLIFENAIDSSWPPKWDPISALVRGRTWRNGKIIVGFTDGSVKVVKLEKVGDFLMLPKSVLKPVGQFPLPELKVLDIETGTGAHYLTQPR